MSKNLHVAFTVKKNTVFLKDAIKNNDCVLSYNYYKNLNVLIFIIFKILCIGCFILNKVFSLIYLNKKVLFNFLKRNYILEFFFNLIFKNYDNVNLHWLGYDILPNASISQLKHNSINIYNHDWQRFTAGCHVPSGCEDFLFGCESCGFSRLKNDLVLNYDKNLIFVSKYQFEKVIKVFDINNYDILPNDFNTNETFKEDYIKRIAFDKSFYVCFVGINDLNNDNKGFYPIAKIISESKDSNIKFISVASSYIPGCELYIDILDNEYLLNLLSVVDIVLVPSKLETFSLVAHEALSCNTPIVVRQTHPVFDRFNNFIIEFNGFDLHKHIDIKRRFYENCNINSINK